MATPSTTGTRDIVRTTIKVTATVLVILALVNVALVLGEFLMLVLLALVIAAGGVAPVERLEEAGAPRIVALAAVYLGVLGFVVLVLLLVVPPLAEQMVDLIQTLPEVIPAAVERLRPVLGAIDAPTDLEGVVAAVLDATGDIVGIVTFVPGLVAGIAFAVVTVISLSALMLLERDRARRWLLRFFAEEDREGAAALGRKSIDRLGAYVRGQLIVMVVMATIVAVGLTLLGLPFALPLALLAFLAEAIPMVGPWIYGIPIIILGFLDSPVTGVIVLVGFIVAQQFESYVLMPLVQGRAVEISPLVTVLAIIAGGTLAGLLGAILAIPVVAVATVLVEDVILPWRHGRAPPPPDPPPEA
jgi:predicted PurR-regulated permease PerM